MAPEVRVFNLLHTFYGLMGNPPEVDGALAAMSQALCSRATVPQVKEALERCMTEKYPVRLPHILKQIPGTEESDLNGMKRMAWDAVESHVNKWLRWDDGRNNAYIAKGAPDLDQRITDSVRRSGGWTVYMRMTDKDFPFQQARFFEEFEAWTEIRRIGATPGGWLPSHEAKKELPPARTSSSVGIPADYEPPKSMPAARPPMDYPSRRKELEQQAEKLKQRKPKPPPWVEAEYEGPGGDDLENVDE